MNTKTKHTRYSIIRGNVNTGFLLPRRLLKNIGPASCKHWVNIDPEMRASHAIVLNTFGIHWIP